VVDVGRGEVAQALVGAGVVVQLDHRTPTGPKNANFSIPGTPGRVEGFTFMRL
jgi:hypothetical protein